MAYKRSIFPEGGYDTFVELTDLPPSLLNEAREFQELKVTPNKTTAQMERLNYLTTLLQNYIIDTEKWNKFNDAITGVQKFFLEETEGYIQTKQQEFDAELGKFTLIGEYNPSTQYYKRNIVTLNFESYLCKQDSLGNPPSDTNYWAKITTRGEQGAPGIGLTFRGVYDNSRAYNLDDAVLYQDVIYYCIQASVGILPTNTAYWTIFLDLRDLVQEIDNKVGVLSDLETNDKTNIVSAINENVNKIGNLSELETSDKSNVVNAINENKNAIDNHISNKNNPHNVTPTQIGAETPTGAQAKANAAEANAKAASVPTARTINGKALSANISLTATDVGAVPTGRTVNGLALSGNITLNHNHIGAVNSVNAGATNVDPNITAEPYILTNHVNSPGQGIYWHIQTYFYSVRTSTANRAQQAISYNGSQTRMFVRHFYSPSWTPWVEVNTGGASVIKAVQRGITRLDISANSYSYITISSVDPSKAFVKMNHMASWPFKYYIDTATRIRVNNDDSGKWVTDFYWEVIEYL